MLVDELGGYMASYLTLKKIDASLYLWLFAQPSLPQQMPGIIPTPRPTIKVQ